MSLLDERERVVPPDAPAGSSRPVSDAKSLWRQAKLPLAVVAALILAGIFAAIAQGSGSGSDLDPTAYTPGGSRAVATLLAEHGSPVTRVDTVPTGGDAAARTLVVPDSSLLNSGSLHALLDAARDTDVVLFVTDDATVDTLNLSATETIGDDDPDPHCGLAAAVAASQAHIGNIAFTRQPRLDGFTVTDSCYPYADGSDAELVALQPVSGSGSLTLVTGTLFLRNDKLDSEGDAALALGLLDHQRPVSWIMPAVAQSADSTDGGTPITKLLPHRLIVAAWELAVTLLLLALWRSRRLGPIVIERLPVTVRAVETVRGRARLYRGSRARDRAALALREAARARLAQRLGLGEATTPPALVSAVAARAGRREAAIAGLLYGSAAPVDDDALVSFAADLDRLVNDATRQTGPR